ncbi:TetR/AcrR family transcriptional regulator [Embleya sp. NBC_00896]|uniref:TetR/AcrR family transcriptional regulator n=1 Tax=Embleya sp. NBC_00896 TaxID=2975961 RepID=UPI002F90F93B|nr:TetR/AcrR family transcriptional regulator [Embleya sp. NBC_00896]
MVGTGNPAAGKPRRARADATRNAQRLVAAAKELFDTHGPDAALDDIAKRAGVGNATLYRHFPTRGELLATVYADEVAALCEEGAALAQAPTSPTEALFTWLGAFMEHVADKRPLALAATHDAAEIRTELFDRWHHSLRAAAEPLLTRAQAAGAIRRGVTTDDLLAVAGGLCIAGGGATHGRRLLHLVREGIEVPASTVNDSA